MRLPPSQKLLGCLSVSRITMLAAITLLVLGTVPSLQSQGPVQTGSGGPGANGERPKYRPGEVLVRFRPGVAKEAREAAHAAVRGEVIRRCRVVPGLQRVRLPEDMTVEEAIARYQRNPGILYAEPNYVIHLDATPDDPQFADMWGLNNTGQSGGVPDADIDAPEA